MSTGVYLFHDETYPSGKKIEQTANRLQHCRNFLQQLLVATNKRDQDNYCHMIGKRYLIEKYFYQIT